MVTYVINIDGEEFTGAPTMTTEEVNKAFDAAVKEWPKVRKKLERKHLGISIFISLGVDFMGRGISQIDDDNERKMSKWEELHGIVCVWRDEKRKLIAWTKDGAVEGPALNMHGPVEDEFNLSIKRNRISPPNSSLEWEEIVINGRSYLSYAVFPGAKEAEEAMAAALAELPSVDKRMTEKVRMIKKIRSADGNDRMQYSIRQLYLEMSRIRNGWDMRHGVAEKFVTDDEKFHIVAWTKEGMIVGPVAN